MGVSAPQNPLFQEMGIRAPVWGRGNPKSRAILVVIVSQNSFVLVFFFFFLCGIAQLLRDTLQNGVSHRCACEKLSTKRGIAPFWGSANLPLKASREIWGIAALVSRYRATCCHWGAIPHIAPENATHPKTQKTDRSENLPENAENRPFRKSAFSGVLRFGCSLFPSKRVPKQGGCPAKFLMLIGPLQSLPEFFVGSLMSGRAEGVSQPETWQDCLPSLRSDIGEIFSRSWPWKLKPGFINRVLVAVIFEASKCL